MALSDPPHRPDLFERFSLGWGNGTTGDAQVYRLLAQTTGDLGEERLPLAPTQSLIWDRSRNVLRLRSTLRVYFPVALQAFEDLDALEALERPIPTGRPAERRAGNCRDPARTAVVSDRPLRAWASRGLPI